MVISKKYNVSQNGLKIKLQTNDSFTGIKKMMREGSLHTVCEEASVRISMNAGQRERLRHL